MRKETDEAKQQRRKSKYSRTDETVAARKAYSRHDDSGIVPDDATDDISSELLDDMKKSYYQTKVVVTQEEVSEIERHTREQVGSERWKNERRKRLTASKVGGIAKMRKTTKRRKKVQEMLYSTFRGNEATRYGMEMEEATKQEYTAYQQQNGNPLTVHNCGLFVSLENPWLAASPDGMVYDPSDTSQPEGLIEIKNPFSARHKTLNEACDSSTF